MMKFDNKYFTNLKFTKKQILNNFNNAIKDLEIAKNDVYLDVRFNYSYNALIKAGIALLSRYNIKVKSAPGHHIKIIDAIAQILQDETINDIGNVMRSKRNTDLYDGGIEVTEKECNEYADSVKSIIEKIKVIINE